MSKKIYVKATNLDGRVAVWDRHPDQPNGEVFITGDGRVHEVAETLKIKRGLSSGALTVAQKPAAEETAPVAPKGKGKSAVEVTTPTAPKGKGAATEKTPPAGEGDGDEGGEGGDGAGTE